MEHLHKQQSFTEELLAASLGMYWEFSTMCGLDAAMLTVLVPSPARHRVAQ